MCCHSTRALLQHLLACAHGRFAARPLSVLDAHGQKAAVALVGDAAAEAYYREGTGINLNGYDALGVGTHLVPQFRQRLRSSKSLLWLVRNESNLLRIVQHDVVDANVRTVIADVLMARRASTAAGTRRVSAKERARDPDTTLDPIVRTMRYLYKCRLDMDPSSRDARIGAETAAEETVEASELRSQPMRNEAATNATAMGSADGAPFLVVAAVVIAVVSMLRCGLRPAQTHSKTAREVRTM